MMRWTGKEDGEYIKEEGGKEIKGLKNGRAGSREMF